MGNSVTPYYQDDAVQIFHGAALATLKDMAAQSVQCVVTSPPYWGLRDYGVADQLGLEPTPEAYVAKMVEVFTEVKRVLRDDGTCWINLGDSYNSASGSGNQSGILRYQEHHAYAESKQHEKIGRKSLTLDGLKPKDLVGIPWRVAFALQAAGWYLRSDIIWSKPNPMPESVTDRPTKAHEYLFLFSKNERYYFDADAVRERFVDERNGCPGSPSPKAGVIPGQSAHTIATKVWNVDNSAIGRNIRSVWTIATQPYPEAHFATFPEALVKPCILAGSKPGDVVMDPFAGSGTALYVAKELGRRAVGIELNAEYIDLATRRMRQEVLNFSDR